MVMPFSTRYGPRARGGVGLSGDGSTYSGWDVEKKWLCVTQPGMVQGSEIGGAGWGSLFEITELPPRAQVMVAQTQAEMWRRNGFAFFNQEQFCYAFSAWMWQATTLKISVTSGM